MKYLIALLACLGLILLSGAGWQFIGSNYVGHANQKDFVAEYHKEEASTIEHKTTKALLRIPDFGDDYVMPILDGVDMDTLDKGVVGHFQNGTEVGQVGNYALAGHRITHGEPFANLPDLVIGDKIIVEKDGHEYTYTVIRDPYEVENDNVWVVENPDHGNERLITLITCASLLPTDVRTVVTGRLTDVK